MQRRLLIQGAAAAAVALPTLVRPQELPPVVKVIVVVPPGATMDIIARLVADHLKDSLKRTVLVDYRPGGTGLVAAQFLKSTDPDGSHLMFAPMAVASFFPFLYPRLPYEADQDLKPVCNGVNIPVSIAVNAAAPVQSIAQFLDRAKRDPLQGNIGTSSMSSIGAMIVHRLRKLSGVDLSLVPYKGGQPLIVDLLGQQVPAGVSVVTDYLAHHRSGKLRILVTSGERRSPLTPELPTLVESGFPDLHGASSIGFFVRAGTHERIVDRYQAEIGQALRSESIQRRLAELGTEPAFSTSSEFARLVLSERARWAPVAREANMRAE